MAAEMAHELLPDRYPFVSEFRRALELDPGNVELRRELAYLSLKLGNEPEAVQKFEYVTRTVGRFAFRHSTWFCAFGPWCQCRGNPAIRACTRLAE